MTVSIVCYWGGWGTHKEYHMQKWGARLQEKVSLWVHGDSSVCLSISGCDGQTKPLKALVYPRMDHRLCSRRLPEEKISHVLQGHAMRDSPTAVPSGKAVGFHSFLQGLGKHLSLFIDLKLLSGPCNSLLWVEESNDQEIWSQDHCVGMHIQRKMIHTCQSLLNTDILPYRLTHRVDRLICSLPSPLGTLGGDEVNHRGASQTTAKWRFIKKIHCLERTFGWEVLAHVCLGEVCAFTVAAKETCGQTGHIELPHTDLERERIGGCTSAGSESWCFEIHCTEDRN